MKYQRQAKIIELVEKYDIETQEELLDMLKKEGFNTAQGTVSRDIKEMKLTKANVGDGRKKYIYTRNENTEILDSYKKVLASSIISMDVAENIIVIKTISGVAMGVATAIDNLKINGIVGSIAGDDTIFLAVKAKSMTSAIKGEIERNMKTQED